MTSSTHPPKTAVVLEEAHKECVFACVSGPLEHVRMCASLCVGLCTCGLVNQPGE